MSSTDSRKRPGAARTLLVCLLSASLATYGVAGCSTPAADPAEEADAYTPTLVHASTVVDEHQVDVILTLDESGTRLVGTRSVISPDGDASEEPVALDLASARALAATTEGRYAVPGVDGLTLDIAEAESRADGASYRLTSSHGHEILVDIDGDTDYIAWAAVGLIASVGGLTILAVCGFLVYTAINRCADQRKCWNYKLTRGFCAGECRNC